MSVDQAQAFVFQTIDERMATKLEPVVSGRIGLKVRRKWKEGHGPIAGVRLLSGEWTGESMFAGATAAVEKYDVVVKAKGPVVAEVECRVAFKDEGTWKIAFRIEASEPVVLVDESFDAPGGGVWSVVLGGTTFRPTHMFHRNADVTNIAVMSDPIAPYHLEPWLKWSNPRHGTWLALHSPPPKDAKETSSDMLMIGLMKPSLWVDPQRKGQAKQPGPFAVIGRVETGQRWARYTSQGMKGFVRVIAWLLMVCKDRLWGL